MIITHLSYSSLSYQHSRERTKWEFGLIIRSKRWNYDFFKHTQCHINYVARLLAANYSLLYLIKEEANKMYALALEIDYQFWFKLFVSLTSTNWTNYHCIVSSNKQFLLCWQQLNTNLTYFVTHDSFKNIYLFIYNFILICTLA